MKEWGWMTRDFPARCVKVTELSSRTDEITFTQSYKPHKGCGGVQAPIVNYLMSDSRIDGTHIDQPWGEGFLPIMAG